THRDTCRGKTGRQADRWQPGLSRDQRVGRERENRPTPVVEFFARRRQHLARWKTDAVELVGGDDVDDGSLECIARSELAIVFGVVLWLQRARHDVFDEIEILVIFAVLVDRIE